MCHLIMFKRQETLLKNLIVLLGSNSLKQPCKNGENLKWRNMSSRRCTSYEQLIINATLFPMKVG